MYINSTNDHQNLGFLCLKDIEAGKQVELILKTGKTYITITILLNSSLFMNDQDLTDKLYSNRLAHERVVSNMSNRSLNIQTRNVQDNVNSIHLITKLRSGGDNLSQNPDQNLEKIEESLKELGKFDKLEKNLVSKSVKDSKSFTDNSFNKIVIRILDKLEPIIGNPKFLRIAAELQKPVKVETVISIQSPSKVSVQPSSKNRMDPEPQKTSAKRSSSIFAEALVPINPHRWPAFTAGSSMASDMPDIKDKLRTPFDNLVAAKEYLETAQSDIQWRARFWQVAKDTATINVISEEVGHDLGAFVAGGMSNKMADRYIDEIIVTEVTKNEQEKLNFEIFKQTAREQGVDVSKVRGTGLMREFVPEFMREDICERPEQNARPDSWEDTNYRYDDKSPFN